MGTRAAARAITGAAIAVALTVSGCGANPGQSDQGTPVPNVTEAEQAPADFATVDAGLVQGLVPVAYNDDTRSIRTEVPMIATARQMTAAMEVLRERDLREASWDNADKVAIGYRMVASGPGILGIIVTPMWSAGGADHGRPALVWYDAATQKVFSSPALVSEEQWPALKNVVTKAAATNTRIDEAKLVNAMDSDPAPQGHGPMIGFDGRGDMVLQFAKGVVADDVQSVRVPAAVVHPLLSDLGRRAADASKAPSRFDGTAPAGSGAATPTASTSAGPGSGVTPSATAPPSLRPSTAVGPDCTKLTCVALTYDDGPSPDTTPQLVRALRVARATATFFQLGQMIKANPGVAKEIASMGHEVASHSISHPDLVRASAAKLKREVLGSADIMEQIYGRRPLLMRPPYGAHNKAVDEAVGSSGAAVIQWNVDTTDWKTRSAAQTENLLLTAVLKANSIVVMHDIHASTVAAAPGVLKGLQDKHVTLVTISELSLNTGGYQAGRAYCKGTAAGKQTGFNCAG